MPDHSPSLPTAEEIERLKGLRPEAPETLQFWDGKGVAGPGRPVFRCEGEHALSVLTEDCSVCRTAKYLIALWNLAPSLLRAAEECGELRKELDSLKRCKHRYTTTYASGNTACMSCGEIVDSARQNGGRAAEPETRAAGGRK